MPRTKEQYAEMREASNQKIKSAAIKIFAEKGLAGTNIQEIAESAGISMGLMYRHYKSKESLFSSLIDNAAEGLKRITQSFESGADPKETMEAVAAEIHEDMRSGEDFLNLMMLITQGLMAKDSGTCDKIMNQDMGTIEAAAKLIRRGQECGEFGQGDPYEMSIFFFSNVQGLAMLKCALGDHFKMPSLSTMTSFLYKGMLK